MLMPPLTLLGAADERLASESVSSRSLHPGRVQPNALRSIAEKLLPGVELRISMALAEGLTQVTEAFLRNFPDNIFWDLDYLTSELLSQSVGSSHAARRIRQDCESIAALSETFGQNSVIRFRYAHDFLYGFDWARWVARDPERRQFTGPFSPEFLAIMLRRGEEIVRSIEGGSDLRYPSLPAGAHRNAYAFSREPEQEAELHRGLARDGWIPVRAWCLKAAPAWNRPYDEVRERRGVGLDHQALSAASGSQSRARE